MSQLCSAKHQQVLATHVNQSAQNPNLIFRGTPEVLKPGAHIQCCAAVLLVMVARSKHFSSLPLTADAWAAGFNLLYVASDQTRTKSAGLFLPALKGHPALTGRCQQCHDVELLR